MPQYDMEIMQEQYELKLGVQSSPGYREMVELFLEENRHLREQVNHLEKRNAELEAKLARYENPHTPPSAQRFKKKMESEENVQKKRGAPKGHRGATRPTKEPDEKRNVTADRCENCDSINIKEIGVEKVVIEEIPQQKIKVIQFDRSKYRCTDCGHEFTARDRDCPQEGRFGISLLTYITMLKFGLRGVLRRIGDFTAHVNSFDITPKGIHDILFRVGKACQKEYFRTLERVRNAEWIYVDETSMKVNGKKWWLWIFRAATDDVLVVITHLGHYINPLTPQRLKTHPSNQMHL